MGWRCLIPHISTSMLFVVLKSVLSTFALVLLKLNVLVVSRMQKLPIEIYLAFLFLCCFIALCCSSIASGMCSSQVCALKWGLFCSFSSTLLNRHYFPVSTAWIVCIRSEGNKKILTFLKWANYNVVYMYDKKISVRWNGGKTHCKTERLVFQQRLIQTGKVCQILC